VLSFEDEETKRQIIDIDSGSSSEPRTAGLLSSSFEITPDDPILPSRVPNNILSVEGEENEESINTLPLDPTLLDHEYASAPFRLECKRRAA
jgi:hypothetical protein